MERWPQDKLDRIALGIERHEVSGVATPVHMQARSRVARLVTLWAYWRVEIYPFAREPVCLAGIPFALAPELEDLDPDAERLSESGQYVGDVVLLVVHDLLVGIQVSRQDPREPVDKVLGSHVPALVRAQRLL